jgi:hypothetical protein
MLSLLQGLMLGGLVGSAGLTIAPADLPHKQATPYSSEAAVAYLNSLRTCSPNNQVMPLPLLDGLIATTTIQGWADGRCVVETRVWVHTLPDQQARMSLCRYRPETLAVLTDDVAYQQARTGNYSFDSSNARDMALSDAMTQDCQFSHTWLDELLPEDGPAPNRPAKGLAPHV